MPKKRLKRVRLNLGCGKRVLKGYTNIDIHPFEGVTVMDVSSLDFRDESVDEILAENILEHLSYYSIQETLWEWYRVLKYKGRLDLIVPDFEAIAKAYLNKKIDMEILHFQLFAPTLKSIPGTFHRCTFDKNYITNLLTKEGFKIIMMKRSKLDLFIKSIKIGKEYLCR